MDVSQSKPDLDQVSWALKPLLTGPQVSETEKLSPVKTLFSCSWEIHLKWVRRRLNNWCQLKPKRTMLVNYLSRPSGWIFQVRDETAHEGLRFAGRCPCAVHSIDHWTALGLLHDLPRQGQPQVRRLEETRQSRAQSRDLLADSWCDSWFYPFPAAFFRWRLRGFVLHFSCL